MDNEKLIYSPESGPDLLRAGEINSMIDTKVVGKTLITLDTIDSTNTECKRRLMEGAENGLVITADEQTGGRGRVGRSFLSPKGKGLYLSAVLKPPVEPAVAVNITAWVAVAVCDAIENAFGVRPQIKWTNDIILGNKKLGGILTEMEIEAETGMIRYIIVGIGINCNHVKEDFPEDLQQIATSLAIETGSGVQRAKLAASLITELDKLFSRFPQEKSQYLNRYCENCCTIGKPVKLVYPGGRSEEALALSVDEDFCLVVRTEDGTKKAVSSGDVSVRGICGYV